MYLVVQGLNINYIVNTIRQIDNKNSNKQETRKQKQEKQKTVKLNIQICLIFWLRNKCFATEGEISLGFNYT